jgi:hypothetical protein
MESVSKLNLIRVLLPVIRPSEMKNEVEETVKKSLPLRLNTKRDGFSFDPEAINFPPCWVKPPSKSTLGYIAVIR